MWRLTRGTSITRISLPSTASTRTFLSVRNLALSLSLLLAALQKSSAIFRALSSPTASRCLSGPVSITPSSITPPASFAKAETVSHMLSGSSPLPSRPWALFTSSLLLSRYFSNSLRSNWRSFLLLEARGQFYQCPRPPWRSHRPPARNRTDRTTAWQVKWQPGKRVRARRPVPGMPPSSLRTTSAGTRPRSW